MSGSTIDFENLQNYVFPVYKKPMPGEWSWTFGLRVSSSITGLAESRWQSCRRPPLQWSPGDSLIRLR